MGRRTGVTQGSEVKGPLWPDFDPEKLSFLFRHIEHAIVLTDARGRIVWVNQGFTRLTEYTLEEAVGKWPADFLKGPETDLKLDAEGHECVKRGQGFTREYVNYTKSGRKFWLLAEVQPVRDRRGRVTHFISIQRDITAEKRIEQELRESQRALTNLLGNLPGLAYRCRNDPKWTMEFVSDGCRELTGYEPGDLLHNRKLSYSDLIHPEDRRRVWKEVQAAIRKKEQYRITYRIVTASGQVKWVWEQGRLVSRTGRAPALLEGFITDITERRRTEEDLAREHTLLRALIDNIPDVVFVKDTSSRFLMVNRAKAEHLGLAGTEDAVGKTDAEFYPPALARQCLEEEQRIFKSGRPLIGKVERQQLAPDQPRRWALVNKVPFRGPDGKVRGLVGISRDITELKNMERRLAEANVKLEQLARTDALTGLVNRRIILELAESEWARFRRYGGVFSVLIADADDFKDVNDTHGHLVGDQALRHLASRLLQGLRAVDMVGRYGGEEFMVVLPETNLEGASAVAHKILTTLREAPLVVAGQKIPLTVSIGAAAAGSQDQRLDNLLHRADHALYTAKHLGKNQLCLSSDQTQPRLFRT